MMRIAEAEGSPEAAIILWLNSFDGISHPVTHIQQLSDGITLFEVVSNIDHKWFKLIRSTDVGDNWVLKINNLKKLYKLVSRYYEEKLGISFSKLPEVNLNAIAKDADTREIIQLCKYILYIAVCCPNNSEYIQRITQLSSISQENLMHFIDEIMKYTRDDQPMEPRMVSDNYTQHNSYEDGTFVSQNELSRISKEKEELEIQNKQLIDKHSELLTKYDKLENEKQDLQARLKDMDIAVAQANETGRADFIMRTEIEHLKQDLQRNEDMRQEQERKLDEQSQKIKELKRKKLEETADLRRQVKTLEEQNHQISEHSQKIEAEYRNIMAFKTLMDSYKEQVASLETENSELVREKNKIKYDLDQANKKIQMMEADKERDYERIQALEDHLQEAQLGLANAVDRPLSQRETTGNTDDMEIDEYDLNDSLEDSLKETNVTELKLTKRRLERQVKQLKEEKAAGGGQKVLVLQHLLDDANRLKNKFEKSYLEVSQERDILQSDMARIREGIPDALVDQSTNTLSLRLHTIELQKEIKSLNETVRKYEEKIANGRWNDDEDLQNKFMEMETKSKHLEEQTKKQLQDINKLLLEKDLLQGQSIEQKDLLLEKEKLNSEMKASLAAFEAKDDEPIKQQNAQLQKQLIQLQEELHEHKIKLKKAREFIVQQDKVLKDTKPTEDATKYDEAIASLKTEVALRDEENDKLKKQLNETRVQARREQQLMISAWYDMSRRANKDIVNSRASPSSWLGQQRRTLDNQLKRR
ncbi:uncharacterized protein BX663DRAFT_530098 [Cokeromyces recurvatus]|uniref:uncharacterized protein n=1 Tax=Cokeromyces recurvatus TaxID=90255 RepID=UPI00221F813C|nr:uncharacterized protein BX663DRAFT_530098 [Cokeromyces recurvatus]KAI7904541.1 hypothetical protein BX663DRAFT_530098 [Cokeromyces recurvatus]